jgi:hypothetical protein
MSGRLVRVRGYRGDPQTISYIVAVPEAERAIELLRSAIGKDGDEITDLGRISTELLKALDLQAGDIKRVTEPTISQQQQQPQPCV